MSRERCSSERSARRAPDGKIPKQRDAGAAVTAALFEISKVLIGLYIGKQALESTYGAAASLVVLLIWVYYSSQLVLMGAEFTRAYATRRARNFCVHIWFYSTQLRTKGSSHGGTCKCPKCRLGRPRQGTGSSRGGQRSPRQRCRCDRQIPEEAALHDVGADAGAWFSARGHLGALAGGRNR